MQIVAFNATLFNNNVGTTGIVMRTADDKVFFQADATGLWTELFDSDIPRLHRHGRVDLVQIAAIKDGDLVLKCSRTMQPRKAA